MNQATPASILVADDNPDNLRLLCGLLEEIGYDVRVATDGAGTVQSVEALPPDLILLDIHMPNMGGYEVCQQLKNDPRFRDIPIIFVSSLTEEFNKVRAFEIGGADYITKPLEVGETKARVALQLELRRRRHEMEMVNDSLLAQQEELEKFNEAMVDRELRNVELKKEVNALARELGRDPPYEEVWETDADAPHRNKS